MSVTNEMKKRRRRSNKSIFKALFLMFFMALTIAPAVIVLIRGEPFLIVLNKDPVKDKSQDNLHNDNPVNTKHHHPAGTTNTPPVRYVPIKEIPSSTISSDSNEQKIDSDIEQRLGNQSYGRQLYIGDVEPVEVTLDFDKKKLVYFIGEIFPYLTWDEMKEGTLEILGLEGANTTTKVEQPLGGISSGQEATILFPSANRIRIVVERTRRKKGGRFEEAIVIKPEVKADNGQAVALNFDAVKRERRKWGEYARYAPDDRAPMMPMVLSMMSSDSLGIYNVSSRQNQDIARANAVDREYRLKIAAAAYRDLDLLDAFLLGLHQRANFKLVYLKPDLSSVTTTPKGLN